MRALFNLHVQPMCREKFKAEVQPAHCIILKYEHVGNLMYEYIIPCMLKRIS
jgi:hypothetical protein